MSVAKSPKQAAYCNAGRTLRQVDSSRKVAAVDTDDMARCVSVGKGTDYVGWTLLEDLEFPRLRH
jgi:hypothetical protein